MEILNNIRRTLKTLKKPLWSLIKFLVSLFNLIYNILRWIDGGS